MADNLIMLDHLIADGVMGADITSVPQSMQRQDNCGFQLIWTGTPTGVFVIQVSLDYQSGTNLGTWSSLTLDPVPTAPSGSAGNTYIALADVASPWIRVFYDFTSGAGTLQCWFAAKGI